MANSNKVMTSIVSKGVDSYDNFRALALDALYALCGHWTHYRVGEADPVTKVRYQLFFAEKKMEFCVLFEF